MERMEWIVVTQDPAKTGQIAPGRTVCLPGARNAAAENAGAEWLLFWQENLTPAAGFGEAVAAALDEAGADTAALAPRVLPSPGDAAPDPLTLELPWASSRCLLVRRSAFLAAGGFDARLPEPAASRDLSVRLRGQGLIRALPAAAALAPGMPAQDLNAYRDEVLGKARLAAKWAPFGAAMRAQAELWQAVRHPAHYPGVRRVLAPAAARQLLAVWPLLTWRLGHRALFKNAPSPLGSPLEADLGPNEMTAPCPKGPLVSVIVRTHSRPASLRRAMQSLTHQTYQNFEVVVTEDGEDTAGEMLCTEFPGLRIDYRATGEHVGRGKAANMGMNRSHGALLCLLDDDDYFYPDHIEQLVSRFVAQPDCDLVLASTMALEADVVSTDPYELALARLRPVVFDHITLMDLCVRCRIPVSGGMFRRALFEQYGGMREDIDGDEDWAMWLRYLRTARRAVEDKADIARATSLCLYPADPAEAARRAKEYAAFDEEMLGDPRLLYTVTAGQLRRWREQVHADREHLRRVGGLEAAREDAQSHAAASVLLASDAPDDQPLTLTAAALRADWYACLLDG